MNEQQQQDMPQKFMGEIYRLYSKLVESGVATKEMKIFTSSDVINDKLVFTDQLTVDDEVIAQATRIDPRPLEAIKEAAHQEKQKVQDDADQVVATIDDLLTKLPETKTPKEKK